MERLLSKGANGRAKNSVWNLQGDRICPLYGGHSHGRQEDKWAPRLVAGPMPWAGCWDVEQMPEVCWDIKKSVHTP